MSGQDFILEIELPPDPSLREALEGALYVLDCTGSVLTEDGDQATLAAYFENPQARATAHHHLLSLDPALSIELRDQEHVDWLELYQQSLVAIPIGARFLVAPDPRLLENADGRIPLVVPQERAFGTGSHPTTSMCLELLESVAEGRRRGLDIGTGSGILAIGMRKLGVERVFAFDNDSDAVGVLTDNLDRNGMDRREILQFFGGVEALRSGSFDLVTMNIIPEVIIPLLPAVRELIATGGTLLLSGILVERADDVKSACADQGFEFESARENGEWWAGHFRLER